MTFQHDRSEDISHDCNNYQDKHVDSDSTNGGGDNINRQNCKSIIDYSKSANEALVNAILRFPSIPSLLLEANKRIQYGDRTFSTLDWYPVLKQLDEFAISNNSASAKCNVSSNFDAIDGRRIFETIHQCTKIFVEKSYKYGMTTMLSHGSMIVASRPCPTIIIPILLIRRLTITMQPQTMTVTMNTV